MAEVEDGWRTTWAMDSDSDAGFSCMMSGKKRAKSNSSSSDGSGSGCGSDCTVDCFKVENPV